MTNQQKYGPAIVILVLLVTFQPAITCSKITRETLGQVVEICSKLTIKTPDQDDAIVVVLVLLIVNFEHISHLVLVFLLLILSR